VTETGQIGFTVFLDANVLAKPVTRTLLMAAGATSGYGAFGAHTLRARQIATPAQGRGQQARCVS